MGSYNITANKIMHKDMGDQQTDDKVGMMTYYYAETYASNQKFYNSTRTADNATT